MLVLDCANRKSITIMELAMNGLVWWLVVVGREKQVMLQYAEFSCAVITS